MSMRERSGAVELNVDADLVRVIAANGRAALFPLPDAEDDMPEATAELDSGTEMAAPDPTRLSDEGEPDAMRFETMAQINALNVDEQAELIALTWIGRGDFEAAELEVAVREAKARATGPAGEALFAMEEFPSHLENGLDAYEEWRSRQAA